MTNHALRRFSVMILFLLASVANANDTAFGGEGSLPMPIKKTEIQMQDETIRIVGHDIDKTDMQGEWHVSCDFTFKNVTDKPITLDVGFPFPIYDEETSVATPAHKQIKIGDALVYDFKVTIDDKTVSTTKQKISNNVEQGLYYEDAYLWKMQFEPNQVIKVHHDYDTGITFNVMGHSLVNYVLKTGVMWWGGSIGNTRIEIIPNTPTRLCSELDPNADFLKSKPEGVQIIGDGAQRQYLWSLNNFIPTEDLNVCLMTANNFVRYKIVLPIVNQLGTELYNLNAMNPPALRILRNTIYAQYGKKFNAPDLQAYFNKQWWYQPNPSYSDNLLTSEDKKALAFIAKAEQRKD